MKNQLIQIYFNLQNELIKQLNSANPLITIIKTSKDKKYNQPIVNIEFKISGIEKNFLVIYYENFDYCSFYSFNPNSLKNIYNKFLEKVSNDKDKFIKLFNQITLQYSAKEILNEYKKDDDNSLLCIATYQQYFNSVFISDEFISIFKSLEEYLDKELNLEIKYISENPFYYENNQLAESESFFDKWSFYLKNINDSELIFNDLDNSATYFENENYEFIKFTSQNVVYIHSKNKLTGNIKVFDSCLIQSILNIDYYINEKTNYLDTFKSILKPYSYNVYPVEILSDGYSKSFEYFINNPESDYDIIFDSSKGFNVKSIHCGNLADDFNLLSNVLDNIIKYGEN